ncbi:hypothetical protein MEQU1_000464 [Malassezia equina]|uniref:Mediator of RNA polymerase II transcription subunit 8 n=1 Tax=Malassezia equina TaxID=1381935 RepID=A0AAF0E9V5_9BASI|nr:hypothetical protein MEQU1_000464 [Malassezia equina]
MAGSKAQRGATDVKLKPVAPPLSHLQTLYQRFDSLRNSIALLREQTLHTPGMEDWPSVQTHYTNLLSHTFSIAAALQSPAAHFMSSQMATLSEFLDNEAQDRNLFGEDEPRMSGLLDETPQLPPIEDKDKDNRLPALAVHPVQPIPDSKLNWLGTLLSTVPEMDVTSSEAQLLEAYERAHPHADEASVAADQAAHDARCLAMLRSWYHMLHAPDEDGETYDFAMRLEDDG